MVLELTNDTAVAYPITPKTTERTTQSLPYGPRIAKTPNAPLHVIQDALSHLPIQLAGTCQRL